MAASFPGAVKSFATRSAGQTIDASHVNDLQDEVAAIEDGYRNAVAPLNSSGSTVATLSVLSHSTIAGSLHVVGNSTFDGDLVVTGTFTGGSQVNPTVKVTHAAATALAADTWTGLDWDTETYDSTGMHSTATNSSRLTFAGSTGIYHVGACVPFSTVAGGGEPNRLRILVNDSSAIAQIDSFGITVASQLAVGVDLRVASTADYVTVQVLHGTSTCRILAESTGVVRSFWAHRVSAS